MNAELLAAAAAHNISTAGKTEREVCFDVLAIFGLWPDSDCSEHRRVTIGSQSDGYVLMRALRAHNEGH